MDGTTDRPHCRPLIECFVPKCQAKRNYAYTCTRIIRIEIVVKTLTLWYDLSSDPHCRPLIHRVRHRVTSCQHGNRDTTKLVRHDLRLTPGTMYARTALGRTESYAEPFRERPSCRAALAQRTCQSAYLKPIRN